MPPLSRRQRQRRRENAYWDRVLRHLVKQGARREAFKRLQEERELDALLDAAAATAVLEEESTGASLPKLSSSKRATHRKQAPAKFTDVCLVDAIRSLGVKVPYLKDGPLWALADGNELLEPFECLGKNLL